MITYEFSVWPHHQGWEASLFAVFRAGLNQRVTMSFTDDEWQGFQASMERQGFTLREVEMKP